jgi:conjugative relaxase-like TrwC/TraI family protein
VLRLHTGTSAYGVKNYFKQSDYYASESVGRWGGKLAADLGRTGPVDEQSFGQMVDNINPLTGERLTLRTKENRRIGEDIIWSLPKDVGAAIMLLKPEARDRVLAMVEGRVEQMMRIIEADVQTRVRRDGAFENRPGDGLAFAIFRHTTARPVDDQAPDPHPHWHCFTFNATRDPAEGGRVKAADFANIYRDRPYYEALFFSLVAEDLKRMGWPIERREGGKWGLAGLRSLGAKFSKRTDAIEAEARRLNITDPEVKDGLGAKTRKKKGKELSEERLRGEWDSQLTDEERAALQRLSRGEAGPLGQPMTAREAVSFAIAHCGEKHSVIPERELLRVALLHGLGDVTEDEVRAELPRQGVFTNTIDGRVMATTDALQEEERFLAGFAARGEGSVLPVGVAEGLDRKMADGRSLNDGQWRAVTGLLDSPNRVNLVEGPAGAGKSSMLAKFDEGLRRQGLTTTFLATTAEAAKVLIKDGFQDTQTVARFLLDTKMQEASRGGRVVVDETSMLGHKDAVKLLQLARDKDLKLIFVGDPMQHGSVPRGAFLHVLKAYGHIKPFRLKEILRQKDKRYLAAAQLLSEGRTLEGFDALDGMGWVKQVESEDDRYRAIAADYLQSLADGQSCLVVSPTHAEARRITDEIRLQLRQAGKLAGEEHEFTRLVAVDATEAERGLATTYRPGDVLQFHQNAKGGFTKGERLVVTDPARVPLAEAGKFSLYRPEKISLAAGDRIRFTGTVKTRDGEHTLRNGSAHTVAGITEGGNIRLDNGWLVDASAGHFRHGFVETSFGSQGKTVQRVILGMAARSLGAMNMEQLYVSASRAKEWLRLYTDDKDAVRWAVQRSSRKLAALDLKPERPETGYAERRRQYMAPRRRRAWWERMRAAWAEKPQQPTPPRTPPTHADRLRQQERGNSYAR